MSYEKGRQVDTKSYSRKNSLFQPRHQANVGIDRDSSAGCNTKLDGLTITISWLSSNRSSVFFLQSISCYLLYLSLRIFRERVPKGGRASETGCNTKRTVSP
jgi:hypothetical protein